MSVCVCVIRGGGGGRGHSPGTGQPKTRHRHKLEATSCPQHPSFPSPPPPHSTDFDGYSVDESVRVVMSGNQEPKSVEITQEAYDQVGLFSLHSILSFRVLL